MDYKYLELDSHLIKDVMFLFDAEKGLGGTSSTSLNSSLQGEAESVVLVCLEGDRLIGAIEFSPIDSHEVRIRNVVVEESHRRKGIGSELLTRVESRIISDHAPMYIKTIPMPYSFGVFARFGYAWDESSEYDWYKKVCS